LTLQQLGSAAAAAGSLPVICCCCCCCRRLASSAISSCPQHQLFWMRECRLPAAAAHEVGGI